MEGDTHPGARAPRALFPARAVPAPRPPPTRAESAAYRICTLRSEEHTSELQSPCNFVCRLLLVKKNFSCHWVGKDLSMILRKPMRANFGNGKLNQKAEKPANEVSKSIRSSSQVVLSIRSEEHTS